MEKKNYLRPVMQVEQFVPNHYCSNCGDGVTTITYKFICDAGNAGQYHDVYLETNGRAGLQQPTLLNPFGGDRRISRTYHPCLEQGGHTVTVPIGTSVDDIFLYGYVIVEHEEGWQTTYETVPVRVWLGENNDDVHCSTHLDATSYTPHTNMS